MLETTADYADGAFTLLKDAFDSSILDGKMKMKIEFYDGQSMNYSIQKKRK